MKNEFLKCGPVLNRSDIVACEKELGEKLPEPMVIHYLKFNGGMPTLDWFPMQDDWDPIWIHEFLPIGIQDGTTPTIQSVYVRIAGKVGYPREFIPFAVDPGGNLFCVDAVNGAIHYWLTDMFDPVKSDSENRQKADLPLTTSFDQFVSSLVSENEAFN